MKKILQIIGLTVLLVFALKDVALSATQVQSQLWKQVDSTTIKPANDRVVEFTGAFGAVDDIFTTFGTSDDAKLGYETADANANALTLILPESSATNIPCLVIGDATINGTDVGQFNGHTDPGLCFVSDNGLAFGRLYQGSTFLTASVTTGFQILNTSTSQGFSMGHVSGNSVITSTQGGVSITGATIGAGAATADSYAMKINQTINDTTTADGTAGTFRGLWINPTLTDDSAYDQVAHLTIGPAGQELLNFYDDGRLQLGSAQGTLEIDIDGGQSFISAVDGAADVLVEVGSASTDVMQVGYSDSGNFRKALEVQNSATQVNYGYVQGSATGDSVIWGATGSDDNVDVTIFAKGTTNAIVFSLSASLGDVSADGFTWYETSDASYIHENKTSDAATTPMIIAAQDAFQNAATLTNPNGTSVTIKAGSSNLLDTGDGGTGGDIYLAPGETSASGPNGAVCFLEHENSANVSGCIYSTGANTDMSFISDAADQVFNFGYEGASSFPLALKISNTTDQAEFVGVTGGTTGEGAVIYSGNSAGTGAVNLVLDPQESGRVIFGNAVAYDFDSVTIADSGDGNPATSTIDSAFSKVRITCNDTDGCNVTMGETVAEDGEIVTLTNISANLVNFADTSGVSELAGAFAAGQWDNLRLEYITDRWVEVSRSDN